MLHDIPALTFPKVPQLVDLPIGENFQDRGPPNAVKY